MKKFTINFFVFNLILCAVFIIFIGVHEKAEVVGDDEQGEYYVVSDYSRYDEDAEYTPLGFKQIYSYTLDEIEGGEDIVFYACHQYVEVYIDGELVYSAKPSPDNTFGKTIGNRVVRVKLSSDDSGKEVTIKITPAYSSSVSNDIVIYQGDYFDIFMRYLSNSWFVVIGCLISVIIGLFFIGYSIYTSVRGKKHPTMGMIGIFAIILAVWKFGDTRFSAMIFDDSILLSNITLIALSLCSAAYMLFFREQLVKKDYKIWDAVITLSIVLSVSELAIQIAGVYDLRETLIMTHINMIMTFSVVIGFMIYEGTRIAWNMRMKITGFCSLLCILGACIDLGLYVSSSAEADMVYGFYAFLIHIIVMGVDNIIDSRRLIAKGIEAEEYKSIAFHDELTGLYNRAYYARYIEKDTFDYKESVIVMFDLNNLKYCNDTYGHEKGDVLIKACGELIKEVFDDTGKCFRLGGDEFCVIVPGGEVKTCEQILRELVIKCNIYNTEHPDDFPVMVAYGCAKFEPGTDYDFADTVRRADREMYIRKAEMKKIGVRYER